MLPLRAAPVPVPKPLSRPAPAPRAVARPGRTPVSPFTIAAFVLAWVAVVGVFLLLISRYDAVIRANAHNTQVQRQVDDYRRENQALARQVAELQSLDRIEKLAATMGMRRPDKMQVASQLPAAVAQAPVTTLAALDQAKAPATAMAGGLWQRVGRWFSSWGSGQAKGQ